MDIRIRYYNDVAILSLSGRLDAATTTRLDQAIETQIAGGYTRLVVDLKKVDFIGSSGIKSILFGAQEARRHGGDIRIANAQAQVKQLLLMAGMDTVIRLFPNVVGATASFFPGPLTETV